MVVDGHAGVRNVLHDRLDRRCPPAPGLTAPHGMLAGIDHDARQVVFAHDHAGLQP